MRGLLIFSFLFISSWLMAQNVPVLESKICRSFSFTDKQIVEQEKLSELLDEYYEGYYDQTVADVPVEVKKRIETLMKSIGCNPDVRNIWSTQPEGCSWYCGANYYTDVSSSLSNQGANDYGVNSIFDDDVRSAWVEGVKGYGEREYIEFFFPQGAPQATSCYIVNGYNKNEKTWQDNSRVKRLHIYENDELIAIANLVDTRDEQFFDLPYTLPRNKEEGIRIRLNEGVELKGTIIRFVIAEVYPGNKFDDTAISELYFDGIGVH